MAPAPSQTKLKRFMENAQSMKTDPDYPIFEIGLKEGRAQMKKEALTFLQNKYLGENAPERGSIEAKAILQLARELSEELQ